MRIAHNNNNNKELIVEQDISNDTKDDKKKFLKAIGTFFLGAIGILFGAEPFIHSLEGLSVEYWNIRCSTGGNHKSNCWRNA